MFKYSKLIGSALLVGGALVAVTASARTVSAIAGQPFFFDTSCFSDSDTSITETCTKSYWSIPVIWDNAGSGKTMKLVGTGGLTCAYYGPTGTATALTPGVFTALPAVGLGDIGKVTCTMLKNATIQGIDYNP